MTSSEPLGTELALEGDGGAVAVPYAHGLVDGLRADELARRTFALDSIRSAGVGVTESFGRTFFLLIALEAFQAPSAAKSLIAGAGGLGLLFTPIVVSRVMRARWRASQAAAGLVAVGAIALTVPLVIRSLWIYVVSAMVCLAVLDAITVLLAPIHAANYPANQRGKYVSRAILIRVVVAAATGILLGRALRGDIARWPWVLGVALLAVVGQAAVLWRMPSLPLPLQPTDRSAFRRRLSLLRRDRILRNTLTSWMFMGVANLMTLPLRVEYLQNPRYGIAADAAKIALLTVTIPAVVRFALTPAFGWIFDRMNFFGVRAAVNVAFAASTVGFFAGRSDISLIVASICFGVGVAGGDVLWSLWTTKFAPPDQVADYMSLHTFTTGLRGVSAPFLGFYLVAHVQPRTVGFIAGVLIAIGSLILMPDFVRTRKLRTVKAVLP